MMAFSEMIRIAQNNANNKRMSQERIAQINANAQTNRQGLANQGSMDRQQLVGSQAESADRRRAAANLAGIEKQNAFQSSRDETAQQNELKKMEVSHGYDVENKEADYANERGRAAQTLVADLLKKGGEATGQMEDVYNATGRKRINIQGMEGPQQKKNSPFDFQTVQNSSGVGQTMMRTNKETGQAEPIYTPTQEEVQATYEQLNSADEETQRKFLINLKQTNPSFLNLLSNYGNLQIGR